MNPAERPQSRPVRLVVSTVAVIVAATAIVLVPQLGSTPAVPQGRAVARESSNDEALSVRVIEVRPHTGAAAAHDLRASGTLKPRRRAPLAFPVAGVVLDVVHDDGDAVGVDAVLARLDPVPFESAVDQARARVAYLEKSLERSRSLREQRALSDEEFDAQSAELAGARAQLRMAEWNLERSVLRAPFAGYVLGRHVEQGQVVGSGTPAYEVIELTTLELEAALPAGDLSLVDLDGEVDVVARDRPGLRATGHVEHTPVRSDTRSGSVPLTIVVPNPERGLLPGMVVEATFTPLRAGADTIELRVPLTAVRMDDVGEAVWRVDDDGRVSRVDVELGPVRGDTVVVTRGLTSGDRVVDEAPDRLREGDVVVALAAKGEHR